MKMAVQRDAQNGAFEEALGAQAAQAEEIAEGDLAAKRFAVERLGAGRHEEQECRPHASAASSALRNWRDRKLA